MSKACEQNSSACKEKCPCMGVCPLKNALQLIGGKWKVPILCALSQDGTLRYNVLKRKIKGITNTMLASSLKELEDDGLLIRRQYDEMPVRVEYELTGLCDGLLPILMQLAHWGIHVHTSLQAEERA